MIKIKQNRDILIGLLDERDIQEEKRREIYMLVGKEHNQMKREESEYLDQELLLINRKIQAFFNI